MTYTNSTPANPTPPGWPDPLESPQAEAIRNGKLDDTEIRNLFDCMERELRLHRERAANPPQVTNAMVEAAAKELLAHGEFSSIPGNNEPNARIAARAALTAAIGAAPKNDASASIAEMRQTAKELRENANGDCNAARQAIYWDGKADALEAAIGAGGQAVAPDWQRIDDALVSCAGLLRTLCNDEIGDTAAAELEYVRSAISNPPAQPGWRMVPEEPTEEMRDDAWNALNSRGLRHFGMSDILAIWKAMLTAAPLPGGA